MNAKFLQTNKVDGTFLVIEKGRLKFLYSVPASVRVRSARRSIIAGAVAIASALCLVLLAPPAQAYDAQPCGPWQWHRGLDTYIQYCPLWRGGVPVHEWAGPNARVVGYLWQGGSANWFLWQCYQAGGYVPDYRYGSYVSDKYAYTRADNGTWGWVSQVFFSGGENYERDGNLRTEPGKGPNPSCP